VRWLAAEIGGAHWQTRVGLFLPDSAAAPTARPLFSRRSTLASSLQSAGSFAPLDGNFNVLRFGRAVVRLAKLRRPIAGKATVG
jgi:hypothetical protein